MKKLYFVCIICALGCKSNPEIIVNSEIEYDLQDGALAFVKDTIEKNDSLALAQAIYLAETYGEDGIDKYAFGIKKWMQQRGVNYDSVRKSASLKRTASEAYQKTTLGNEINYSDKSIDEQFSNFDGAHIKLQDFIKERMNNPDSYDHVSSKYKVRDNYLEVILSFRGTNKFNAVVLQEVRAKCDLSTGDVLAIE